MYNLYAPALYTKRKLYICITAVNSMNTRIPLANRIKKQTHRDIALAQDLIVEELYSVIPKAVFHGGTSIWRCYQGKRFSEDLDFYLPRDLKAINQLFSNLEKKGFEIKKKKISERSIYSLLTHERTNVRFEATFQSKESILADYETINGNFLTVRSISQENLIVEKALTYNKRRKIRDLWDVFFLIKTINNKKSLHAVKELLDNYKKPLDEEDLKIIILEGINPTAEEMKHYLERKWENPNI